MPAAGLTDQVTAEFGSPVTVGTNVSDSPADSEAVAGEIVTDWGGGTGGAGLRNWSNLGGYTAFPQRHQLVGSVEISGLVINHVHRQCRIVTWQLPTQGTPL